jgi:crotonobetainyl-CoA:carnitine CoA-transferase CaiB-like acyl-CoA transferase
MSKPLNHLKIIELGQVLAAPFAAAIFADLGAEVIKIERPEGGDDARSMGAAFAGSDALIFQVFNRGKASVTLDLKTAQGLAALHTLLQDADAFIHNLRPGVAHDLGIDAAALTEQHPRLIYAELSAFGHIGPLAMNPGYEPLIQAFSGLSATNGGEGDPPMRSAVALCDQGTGMWLVIGILSLLQRRAQTGRGGVVQGSLLETALSWNAQRGDAILNGQAPSMRHRSGHPGFVPYQAFDAQDAPLLVCCGNDRLFAKLATVLRQTAWATDEKFATNRARIAHQAELLLQIQTIFSTQPRDVWLAQLEVAGVPASPVNTLAEALAHPQVKALGMAQTVQHGEQTFQLTGFPLSIDGVRPALRRAAPALGQHNATTHLNQESS